MAFFPSNFMLQTPNDQNHHHFHANDEGEDNFSDDGSQLVGDQKKRRLNMEQVKTLERSFELGNKLDVDRKMQLAKALGLQPRQVAIWFQNRRARWKTKQLERDFDLLKKQFDCLKADNQSLLAHNKKLQAELLVLKGGGGEPREAINLNKETYQDSSSNRSENNIEIKLDISTRTRAIENEISLFGHHQTSTISKVFFPPSSSSMINRPNIGQVAQLFQSPQTNRFDQPIKEESFNNMCCAIDDHSGLWPWIDQQNFN